MESFAKLVDFGGFRQELTDHRIREPEASGDRPAERSLNLTAVFLNTLNDLAHRDAWVDVRAVAEGESADRHG
jgi:hypothetical protein